MSGRRVTGAIIILIAFWVTGCNVTKNFPPHEYLLTKNKFRISPAKVSKDELSGYLQQVPNPKLFGLFRANIAFYNAGSKGKQTKFKKWMKNKLGRPPVIVDSSLTQIAKKQMTLYLANKGYFQAVVRDSLHIKKKKASVFYYVKLNEPYLIRRIQYSIADTQLSKFFYMDTIHTLLHVGKNYDTYLLDNERTRITTALMNHGYYHFSNQYIKYRVDSTMSNKKMDVTLEIRNPVVPSLQYLGTFTESNHIRNVFGKIMVYPEYSLLQSDTLKYDTLKVNFKPKKHDTTTNTYYFLYENKPRIKPRTIAQMIFMKSGTWYNINDVTQTYNQLGSLQIFNYMNIQLKEEQGSAPVDGQKLDCRIHLSRVPLHSFGISTDGTNSSGVFGVQGSVNYMNRNIFRGAQLFKINLTGSTQAQGSIDPNNATSGLFNTIELGATTSLTFPQFVLPVRPESLSKTLKPRTTVTLGYNFQKTLDYDRHITNASFGYSWNQTEKIKHVLNPVEISLVKIFPDSSFTAYIDSLHDKRLKNQYTDHIVAGLKYTFTYNGQDVNKVKDFFYILSNFETGGNIIYGINSLFNSKKSSAGYYTLFNIQYSQFVRPDFDLRFYHFYTKTISLVSRFYGGVGVPYGNSIALPFEKAFFAGGANDIRGWKMGTLGPGRYHNDTLSNSFNQTGDLQLQLNLEYRFPVYKYFRSALFIDMGNVWLLHKTSDLPGGKIEWKYFWDDIAFDAGFGIRADFDYFIIRLDPAVPIRIPYYQSNNHWYISKLNIADIIWNFGIGYPF